MRYRWPSLAACAGIAWVLVLTGCGAGATESFKASYCADQAPLRRTFVDISDTFTHAQGRSIAEIARSVTALADRFHRELVPLEALKPPTRVATAFAALTSSLDRVERDLRAISAAVTGRDLPAAHRALASLQGDAGSATDAAAAVTQKLAHK